MSKRKNPVYQHFKYNESSKRFLCNECSKLYSGDYGENLMKHLRSKHKDIYEKLDTLRRSENELGENNQISMEKYMTKAKTTTIVIESNIESIKNIAIELICINGRPLSILEDSSIMRLFNGLTNQLGDYHINRKNIKDAIRMKAIEIRRSIREQLEGKVISLKVDIATRLRRSILGVNCQIIKSGEIKIYNLAMKVLKESHTAEYINSIIKTVIEEYGISISNIYSITTDNGRNILSAVDYLRCEQIIENINGESESKQNFKYR